MACDYSVRNPQLVDSPIATVFAFRGPSLALNGSYVGFAVDDCDYQKLTGVTQVAEVNLAERGGAGPTGFPAQPTGKPYVKVGSLRVGRHGDLIWIACPERAQDVLNLFGKQTPNCVGPRGSRYGHHAGGRNEVGSHPRQRSPDRPEFASPLRHNRELVAQRPAAPCAVEVTAEDVATRLLVPARARPPGSQLRIRIGTRIPAESLLQTPLPSEAVGLALCQLRVPEVGQRRDGCVVVSSVELERSERRVIAGRTVGLLEVAPPHQVGLDIDPR